MSKIHSKDPTYSKEYIELAQLMDFPTQRAIEIFIRNVGVNYVIKIDSLVGKTKPYFLGCTLLHLALTFIKDRDNILNLIIKHKADITIKNYHGYTPLRQTIDHSECSSTKRCLYLRGKLTHSVANKFLQMHIDLNNAGNPVCKMGVSHFHIACMMNHKHVVTFFLNAGVDVNSKVFVNSFYLSGYTPLHVAARYSSLDVAEILLNFGADVTCKNEEGMTPLHLLIVRNKEIMDALIAEKNIDRHKDFLNEYHSNEQIINLIIDKMKISHFNFVDDIGLTHFHISCIKKDYELIHQLFKHTVDIDSPISLDSPFLPGYTPLHFAAHFDFKVVKILLQMGANILTKDKNGLTPLDLCVERYSLKDIHWILSNQENLKNILLSNGIKLTSILASERKFSNELKSKKSKNIFVSQDSPLVPGFTLLHLATIFEKESNYQKVSELYKDVEYKFVASISTRNKLVIPRVLDRDDIITPNQEGMTPIHLALHLQKFDIVKSCLAHNITRLVNVTDRDDLSHFHIACAANKIQLVEQFLKNGVNVDWPVKSSFLWKKEKISKQIFIQSGSTPLHISVACNRKHITELLLKYGANPLIKDEDGLTCVHVAFIRSFDKNILDILLATSWMTSMNSETNEGFSHLHIACYNNNLSLVKALLKISENINKPISSELKSTLTCNSECLDDSSSGNDELAVFKTRYSGYTPLHFAAENLALETIELLIKNGADIHAKNISELSPLHIVLNSESKNSSNCINYFSSVMSFNDNECIDSTGLTQLHLACKTLDEYKVKNLLNSGANVNASINSESPIWAGNTPLHIIVSNEYANDIGLVIKMISLLIEYGADVTIKNEENLTPLLATKTVLIRKLLLSSPTIFNANPIDNEGLSHFHIACQYGDAKIIEEFLKRGVDVSCPKDFFAFEHPGYSPLHFAALNELHFEEIINELLKYNADTNVENTKILSPLFALAEFENIQFKLDTICGIFSRVGNLDLNKKNIFGYTPLQWVVEENVLPYKKINLAIFLKYGAMTNLFSPKNSFGLMAVALWDQFKNNSEAMISEIVDNATDLMSINECGFNAIHNIVSYKNDLKITYFTALEQYKIIIQKFLQKGCEIDCQDKRGRTALHLAYQFQNPMAIKALLSLGADINILDTFGRIPVSYNIGNKKFTCYSIFKHHIDKLLFYNLEICRQNYDYYANADTYMTENNCNLGDMIADECTYVESTLVDDEDNSLRVNYLLSETMVALYPKMKKTKRNRINRFFDSERENNFPNFGCLLKLQYRKALARKQLLEPAKESLMKLCRLPDVCNDLVLEYLRNGDLKNLIALQSEDCEPSCKRLKLS